MHTYVYSRNKPQFRAYLLYIHVNMSNEIERLRKEKRCFRWEKSINVLLSKEENEGTT